MTAREFARLGIHSLEHLREMGWREACLLWAERFPARINLNAFRSVIGAVYDVAWNELPPQDDAEARRLLARLRQEAKGEKSKPR